MTQATQMQQQKAELFRGLHAGHDIVVLPCAWDVASAKLFEAAGYKAIGTTSAGIAATFGYPDGQKIGFDEHLEVIRRIVRHVNVPVSVDLEAGYAASAEGVAANVDAVLEAGAVGVNIEDENHARTGGLLLEPAGHMVEKLRAIRAVGEARGIGLFINAKTDVVWLSAADGPEAILRETVRRANVYGAAGADCIFIPGDFGFEAIARLVEAISYPLNLVIKGTTPPLSELRALTAAAAKGRGVRRLSMGSGPMRAAMGLTRTIAREVLANGTYDSLLEFAIPYGELVGLFKT